MDILQDLKTELHKYDFEADPQGIQADKILNILDTALDRDGERLQDRKPPLDVVVYALKSILFPSFLPELMSEFIHLFTMVEFYRLHATEKASTLLTWHTFYADDATPKVHLTKDEEEYCSNLVETQEEIRNMFIDIIAECCLTDLARLWLANSNTKFWIRWNEYFSIFKRVKREKLSHSFHYNMSPEEISTLHGSVNEFSNFMEATSIDTGMFESKPFRDQFPDPGMSPKVLHLIEYHLNYVQEAVQRLEAVVEQLKD
ncbi:hypothetical protein BDZ97DRAFT_1912740 [Flammula alnicola]|nr:hypothetical protein BDZ97DRAFT_1912740 [Flammula alnicola]